MTVSGRATFGELLKRHRVAAGLSQAELAQRARMTARGIRDLERDVHSTPSRDTVSHLVEALELAAADHAALEEAASRPPASPQASGPARDGPRTDVLLATKLMIPARRSDLTARSRLTDRLDSALRGTLTLVAAPAGFGKTTLLTAWHSAQSENAPEFAWVSLDSGDNDQVRFWRYVVTALERLRPGVGMESLALLQSPQSVPIERVLAVLLNALADLPHDVVLVLDDYHLIEEKAIHRAVAFLLEHLPPRLHVAIATRDDPPLPVARLRARGELTEVRAVDLRFTTEEAAHFLNEVMGLHLAEEDVQALEARTEGWIAGLQLAALAMRDRGDVEGFIAAFTGSSRFVADYLIEDVVLRQPASLQNFLVQTAILDRMCASLCDAVMTWDDGSQAMLEQLERANLFVVPLDDERQWYRYHHLFAEVLRHRLSRTNRALVLELHLRASAWFQQHSLVAEAIGHALASADMARAASLVEDNALPIMLRGQVQTVLGWLNTLPDELVRSRAALCIAHAVALMFIGQMDGSEARLADAEQCVEAGLPDEEARSVLGTAAVVRANMAQFRGDMARFVALSRQALELLPETQVIQRAVAEGGAACSYLVTGDVTHKTERQVTAALATTRASGDLMATVTGLTHIARMHVLQGRLRQAEAVYREVDRLSPDPDGLQVLVGSAAYFFGLGDLLRERNDLDAAEGHLKRGMDLVRGALRVNAEHVALGYTALALLHQARGEYADALATLDDFARLATERNFVAPLLLRAATVAAWMELAQGNLAAASRWVDVCGLSAGDEPSFPHEVEYLTLVRILIARGRNNLESKGTAPSVRSALHLLDRLLASAETAERMRSVIEIQILRALALHAIGETGQAAQALERALALAEPEGYVRSFVDEGAPLASLLSGWLREHASDGDRDPPQRTLRTYGERLLTVFEQGGAARRGSASDRRTEGTVGPPLDPLTDRELQVLRLLAAGLSNREIGAELYISLNTVKWYVKSLYSKLGVQSRTRAVARARALHLIPV